MQLERANVVLVGAMNPAILTPMWLIRQGICQEPQAEPTMEFEFGPAQTIKFVLGGLTWVASQSRLIVESTDGSDPSSAARGVFSRLPHTPFRAVGTNHQFVLEEAEWAGGLPTLQRIDPGALDPVGTAVSRTWIEALKLVDETVVTVKALVDAGQRRVEVNFNRIRDSYEGAMDAAGKFASDSSIAKQIVGLLTLGKAGQG